MPNPDRIERYPDFTQLNTDKNGVYDPQKGFGGLLSTLTPDPKIVVLNSMQDGVIYFNGKSLISDVKDWLEDLNLPKEVFPLSLKSGSVISYCRSINQGEVKDGSLVEVGAVVKKVEDTGFRQRTGYMRSLAGKELASPLLIQACEFVYEARRSSAPPKFDSMWKALGSVSNPGEHIRPLSIYAVVSFLINHPGIHRLADLEESMSEPEKSTISVVLSDLGEAGLIDYKSPGVYRGGKHGRGFSNYVLAPQYKEDPDKLRAVDRIYGEIRGREARFYHRTSLERVLEFMAADPNRLISKHLLEEAFPDMAKNPKNISTVLGHLAKSGILQTSSDGFKGGVKQSEARANYITYLFNGLVLEPTKYVADTLTPLPRRNVDPRKLAIFLQNFKEERTAVGPEGGDEVRDTLLQALAGNEEVSRTQFIEIFNQTHERQLSRRSGSFINQMDPLISQGVAEQSRRGYFRLVK